MRATITDNFRFDVDNGDDVFKVDVTLRMNQKEYLKFISYMKQKELDLDFFKEVNK